MKQNNTNKQLDKTKNGFREAYDNLPCKTQKQVRKFLMDSIPWGIATFYNKLKGVTAIKPNEVEAVEEAFKKYGLDAWTGQTLFFR